MISVSQIKYLAFEGGGGKGLNYNGAIEAIKFRMEQLGLKQKDLAQAVGFASRVSEVLNKKRKLTLEMIRKLHVQLNIPTEVLVQEY